MGLSIDDVKSTLEAWEDVSSLDDVPLLCTTDVSGRALYRTNTVSGYIHRFINRSCSLFGKRVCVDATVAKTRSVFDDFVHFLESPASPPSLLTKHICVLAHSPLWMKRLMHASTILGYSHVDLAVAERLSASYILENITGMDVSWVVLERVFRQMQVSKEDDLWLDAWATAIRKQETKISRKLLLGVFCEVVERSAPAASRREKADNALLLALLLAPKFFGFFGNDPVFAREIEGRVSARVPFVKKKCAEGLFDPEGHFSAYPLQGDPSRIVLISPIPLCADMLGRYLVQEGLPFPLLHLHERDIEGEYIIADAVIGSLRTVSWGEGEGISESNRPLALSLSDIVKRALTFTATYDMQLDLFLVTYDSKICLGGGIPEKSSFFSLREIERFIGEACRLDRKRMAYVMKMSGFYESSYAPLFSRLLILAKSEELQIDAAHIEGFIRVHSLQGGKPLIEEASMWLAQLSAHFQYASQALQKRVPLQTLLDAFLALQKELGFMCILPDKLGEAIVSRCK